MADKKISQLTALSAANLAPSTDVLAIVDTSATETKKIVAQDLINGVLNVASAVGIGTTSPGARLDVRSATGYQLHTTVTDATSAGGIRTFNSGGVGLALLTYGPSYSGGSFGSVGGNGSILVQTGNAPLMVATDSGISQPLLLGTNGTERARITANGELCIGTTATTSSARLDVKGVDSTGTNYCVFFENSGSALLLAVQNDGRWRSGTAAASPYNYVVGSTNRDLFVDNGGDIGYVSSVRASKTNITPDVDTDWLLQLNPVTFNFRKRDEDGNYTDEADGPIKHGLIAEEVEQVNADLCFYDDADKGGALRGVNYSHLITPMLKLIQKQQAAIAMLEAKVSALEAK